MFNSYLKSYFKYVYISSRSFIRSRSRYDSRFLKSRLIASGLVDIYKNHQLALYSYASQLHFGTIFNNNLDIYLACDMNQFNQSHLKFCERIVNSRRAKCSNLKKKINYMLSLGQCCFLTLTWDDKHLNNADRYRRECVKGCLNKFPLYVANIDFGQDDNFTHREHYHAIILSDNFDSSLWTYGFSNSKKIDISNASALSKYINKLTYHAFKNGASSSRSLASLHFFTKDIKKTGD